MKKNILFHTNVLVCVIIALGFVATSLLSSQANYRTALENIEQVSSLTSEGIHYQLSSIFTKPVHVSLTMANDSLLKEYLLMERQHLNDEEYILTIRNYLDTYQKKYQYDSVFLVSAATRRYYNFNGVDRVMVQEDPENIWYDTLLANSEDYSLNVDNDEVAGADNVITIFVNCKIKDPTGATLGVVGVGLRVDNLQGLLMEYEKNLNTHSYLIDPEGNIEISASYTGYEKVNLFQMSHYDENTKNEILAIKDAFSKKSFWTYQPNGYSKKNYVVTRYIPELSWYLVTEGNTNLLVQELQKQFFQTLLIILALIILILIIITRVIRAFNRQMTQMSEEHQAVFRAVTEQLYDNIYELNITKNCAAGASTRRYFENLGVPKDAPFDQALQVIAQKQIKAEFRDGYLTTFSPANVLRQYQAGNDHLQYDLMIAENGTDYFWMRIDAHIYYLPEDDTVRMFVYRKNIDAQRRREIHMTAQAQTDSLTGLLNKTETQRQIERRLFQSPGQLFGFFIFDIDNFKQVNDQCGHAFGDFVITRFAQMIKEHFEKEAVIGRIGGDEFVAFAAFPNQAQMAQKAAQLSSGLNCPLSDGTHRWALSTSMGISAAPKDGAEFSALYQNADAALYHAKKNGKSGYCFYQKA